MTDPKLERSAPPPTGSQGEAVALLARLASLSLRIAAYHLIRIGFALGFPSSIRRGSCRRVSRVRGRVLACSGGRDIVGGHLGIFRNYKHVASLIKV
jgi:hypothetical protein